MILIENALESWIYPIDAHPTAGDIGIAAIKAQADVLNPKFKTDAIETPGRTVSTTCIFPLILILVTGIYLWWPSIRKLALGFRIIRNRGRLALNMSLHKVAGIVFGMMPFVLMVTGLTIWQLKARARKKGKNRNMDRTTAVA